LQAAEFVVSVTPQLSCKHLAHWGSAEWSLQKFGVLGLPFCELSQRLAQPPAERRSTHAHVWHPGPIIPAIGMQWPVLASQVSFVAHSESIVQPAKTQNPDAVSHVSSAAHGVPGQAPDISAAVHVAVSGSQNSPMAQSVSDMHSAVPLPPVPPVPPQLALLKTAIAIRPM
jgi:hypothetical protein